MYFRYKITFSIIVSTIIFVLLCVIDISIVSAQVNTGTIGDSNIKPLTAGGSIGFTTQAYQSFGITARQPALLARANANVSFSLFGMHSGLNLLYSTDDSRLRQSMNRLGFSGDWHWIHLAVGDVSPQIGKYSLNGATIRGGYLKLSPGIFRLAVTAGRSQRAIKPGPSVNASRLAYRQWMLAGKIGLGDKEKTHFHIDALYAIDDKSSIDTTQTNLSLSKVTPKENLELTPDLGISMFKGAFKISSQVTVSVFTRDINSNMLDLSSAGVPGFITGVFKPRISTRVNYAGNANMALNLNVFSLNLGVERIQPGFTSLGISQVRDDRQTINIAPKFKFFGGRLVMSNHLSLGQDNLSGTRFTTQKSTQFGTNIQTQLSNMFTIAASYNLFLHQIVPNASVADSLTAGLGQTQTSNNFMIQPTLSIQSGSLVHTVSLSFSYLTLNTNIDQTPATNQTAGMPSNYGSNTYTGTLSYSVSLPSGMGINASANYMKNQSNAIDINNIGINTGLSYTLFNNKMTLSLNGGYNTNKSTPKNNPMISGVQMAQITGNGSASYRLTGKDSFSLSVRFLNNQAKQGSGRSFQEVQGRFQYRHRF